MKTLLILIFIILVHLLCAAAGAIGFRISEKCGPQRKQTPPALPPAAERLRAAERAQREYSNFLNYDGSEQEEIN